MKIDDKFLKKYNKSGPRYTSYPPATFFTTEYENVDLKTLLNGLKLVSDYLEKSILKPNNLNLPSSRTHFVSLLK